MWWTQIAPPPDWNRINVSAKIWGGGGQPALPTALPCSSLTAFSWKQIKRFLPHSNATFRAWVGMDNGHVV